jgi:hypothetical protein
VELLEPLTVGNIGFTTGEIFDLFPVDEGNADAGGFEHLEEGNPIDTGRFHNDSGNVVFFEKGDEIDVVIGESSEGSDITILDTDENRFIAYIDTGTVGVDFGQRRHNITPK